MRLNTGMPKVDLGKRKFKADGGYGWIVCCGTFIVNFVVFGIHNSFGVLYVSLLDDLNLGEMQTGMSNLASHFRNNLHTFKLPEQI